MSIATEISRLQQAKADIKSSIEAKGVNVPSSAALDDYSGYVDRIQQGGGIVEESDVNFYDYDGTILYAYTKADFLALNEMPANPTHQGLTAQGWNWVLADAKSYVNKYGGLIIGQNYITDDGKTRLYVSINDDYSRTVYLTFSQTTSHGVTIDWGDETTVDTISGTGVVRISHVYLESGDYVILLNPVSGTLTLGGNSSAYSLIGGTAASNYFLKSKSMLKKVEIGTIAGISDYCFQFEFNCETITMPIGLTSLTEGAMHDMYALKAFIIPAGVTTLEEVCFYFCQSLKVISIPNTVTTIEKESLCRSYHGLEKLYLPEGVTLTGTYALSYNYCLTKVVCPSLVIQASTFYEDTALKELILSPNVVTISADAMSNCRELRKTSSLKTVTTFGSGAFTNHYLFDDEIELCNELTSLPSSMFVNNHALTKLTVPENVTSIGNSCFSGCNCLETLVLKPAIPPTITSTNILNGHPSYGRIVVPYGSISDYQNATNWSSFKIYICGYSELQPQEVEYLYSDGNGQTINTFISNHKIGKVKIRFKYDAPLTGTSSRGDGFIQTNSPASYGFIGIRGQQFIAQFGGGSDFVNLGAYTSDWHEIELDVVNGTAKLDSNAPVPININKGVYSMRPWYLFGNGNTPASASHRSYAKIWDKSGKLIFDAIPVRIGTTGYMYDKVGHYVLPNMGTGNFTYGGDVN